MEVLPHTEDAGPQQRNNITLSQKFLPQFLDSTRKTTAKI